jgi:biopolymer transport protein ExbD
MGARSRRSRKHGIELDITAFMNLIVVLVPFLLSSAVFSHLSILDMNLPAAASGPTAVKDTLQLEVIIRANALEVSDRNHGLIKRIDNISSGYDYNTLSLVMQQIKARFPESKEATILSEPDTAYDTLVQVMDVVRVAKVAQVGTAASVELFPDMSIGDAPVAASLAPVAAEPPKPAAKGKHR